MKCSFLVILDINFWGCEVWCGLLVFLSCRVVIVRMDNLNVVVVIYIVVMLLIVVIIKLLMVGLIIKVRLRIVL